MTILLLLIGLALFIAGLFTWAFMWAVREGQFDDMDSPAVRILLDDDTAPSRNERNNT
ncbi:MAG: cbb3-type cytochrome oxidase assembly protein CcoS [Pseudomonadota bacterium]